MTRAVTFRSEASRDLLVAYALVRSDGAAALLDLQQFWFIQIFCGVMLSSHLNVAFT